MKLRDATAQDAALISRTIAASWRGAYEGFIDPVYLSRLPDEYWLPSMRSWLESGRMYALIAEVAGEPVGCIVFGRGRDEDHADWGEIVSLYLLPQAMGQGIGSALLSAAVAGLREDGYDKVYLWAILDNKRAWRFYQRHGFRFTADLVKYRIGSGEVTDVRLVLEG